MAAIFQPDPFNWLFGAGIGTNIGAALVCALLGWRTIRRAWRRLHGRLDHLQASHDLLHERHAETHAKLDRLLERDQ